jgi:hypothetical protein
MNITNNDFCFVILRCVKKKSHSKLWEYCYDSIRKLYTETTIIIIDDNSNKELLDDKELTNTIIICSEFNGAGEILPYYYFNKYKWCNKMIFLHDSMFIKEKIIIDEEIKFLFNFTRYLNEDKEKELSYLSQLKNNNDLINLYNSNKWCGCFGVCSYISINFLELLHEKTNFLSLIDKVNTRKQRCCMERIFSICAFYTLKYLNIKKTNLLNPLICSIFDHPRAFKINFKMYNFLKEIIQKDIKNIKETNLIKIINKGHINKILNIIITSKYNQKIKDFLISYIDTCNNKLKNRLTISQKKYLINVIDTFNSFYKPGINLNTIKIIKVWSGR